VSSYPDTLKQGASIGCYQIEEVLGRGGFAVTYLAIDRNLDVYVAIKEYLPREIITRNEAQEVFPRDPEFAEDYEIGLQNFAREAKTLALFKHPNIVRVHQVLHENNTAYMVMDYEHGRELAEVLEDRESLSEDELRPILLPVLDAVAKIHEQGYVHRDIKPSNIYLRDNGPPVLLDFGAARYTLSETTQELTAVVTVGYTPIEQYNVSDAEQGPWTDIYALAAVLYEAVTGQMPVDSVTRASTTLTDSAVDPLVSVGDKTLHPCSDEFFEAIDQGLRMDPLKRPQSVEQWLATLNGQLDAAANQIPIHQPSRRRASKLRTRAKAAIEGESPTAPSVAAASQGIDIDHYPDTRIEPSFGESLESFDVEITDRVHFNAEESLPTPAGADEFLHDVQTLSPDNDFSATSSPPAVARAGYVNTGMSKDLNQNTTPLSANANARSNGSDTRAGENSDKSHTQEIRDVVRRDIMKRNVDPESAGNPERANDKEIAKEDAASPSGRPGLILTRGDAGQTDHSRAQIDGGRNRQRELLEIEETDWDYEPQGTISRWKWLLPATGLAAVFVASLLYVNRPDLFKLNQPINRS